MAEAQKLAKLGSWEFDAVTNEITWSDETFRVAGGQPTAHLSLEDYVDTVHPEDLTLLQDTLARSSAEKIPYEIELRHRKPDGSYNHTLTRGKPILVDCNVVKLIGSVLDITERKRAEEELRRARVSDGTGTRCKRDAQQPRRFATERGRTQRLFVVTRRTL